MEIGASGFNQQEPAKPQFTDKEKRDELARECNLRKSVYPGQVRQGRMTQIQADRQKAIMHSIWEEFDQRVRNRESQHQSSLDLSSKPPKTIDAGIDGIQNTAVTAPAEDCAAEKIVAGGGDGEIGRPVRPYSEESQQSADSTNQSSE